MKVVTNRLPQSSLFLEDYSSYTNICFSWKSITRLYYRHLSNFLELLEECLTSDLHRAGSLDSFGEERIQLFWTLKLPMTALPN